MNVRQTLSFIERYIIGGAFAVIVYAAIGFFWLSVVVAFVAALAH